jgi:hypothetical protein
MMKRMTGLLITAWEVLIMSDLAEFVAANADKIRKIESIFIKYPDSQAFLIALKNVVKCLNFQKSLSVCLSQEDQA